MGKSRSISFISKAPDDWEFDDAGNVLAPGNAWNARFVSMALKSHGYEVETPRNHEDYGWEFFCSLGLDKFWLLVAMGPNESENYIWIKKVGFVRNLIGGERSRDALMDSLQSTMRADKYFSDVHEGTG